ncbi:MAG: type II secretion system protein [Rhodocyclaceae bacterium]|nr:type II secretion system protein [Rhodocyclaceae bacterium]MDZ4215217.1 type II secretion system protein [Rhodocyclaceae bacterium]
MRTNAGFTIVELIVTMVIIGIMAVTVVPRFNLMSGFSARGYADQIESYLRFTQKSALASRRVTRLELSNCTPANGACNSAPALCVAENYSAAPACGTACPVSGCSAGWCALRLPGQFASPQSRVTVSDATTVCFDAMGRPINGGLMISVGDESGTLARTVTVENETGYVH